MDGTRYGQVKIPEMPGIIGSTGVLIYFFLSGE